MNATTATEADFTRHAQNLASGYATMSPAPRRFTNPTPQPAPPDTVETPAPAAPVESTTHRVIRESGLVGTYELTLTPQADITGLTKTHSDQSGENQAGRNQRSLRPTWCRDPQSRVDSEKP